MSKKNEALEFSDPSPEWTRECLRDLRNALCDCYVDTREVIAVCLRAGFRKREIALIEQSGVAKTYWTSVCQEAKYQGRLYGLLDVLVSENDPSSFEIGSSLLMLILRVCINMQGGLPVGIRAKLPAECIAEPAQSPTIGDDQVTVPLTVAVIECYRKLRGLKTKRRVPWRDRLLGGLVGFLIGIIFDRWVMAAELVLLIWLASVGAIARIGNSSSWQGTSVNVSTLDAGYVEDVRGGAFGAESRDVGDFLMDAGGDSATGSLEDDFRRPAAQRTERGSDMPASDTSADGADHIDHSDIGSTDLGDGGAMDGPSLEVVMGQLDRADSDELGVGVRADADAIGEGSSAISERGHCSRQDLDWVARLAATRVSRACESYLRGGEAVRVSFYFSMMEDVRQWQMSRDPRLELVSFPSGDAPTYLNCVRASGREIAGIVNRRSIDCDGDIVTTVPMLYRGRRY